VLSVPLHLEPGLSLADKACCFADDPFLLILDSAGRHRERDSRYSVLTSDPARICRIDTAVYGSDPFETLRGWERELKCALHHPSAQLPPFCGGIAGLLSYELGESFERLPRTPGDVFRTPAMLAGLFDWAIVQDHLQKTLTAWVLPLNGRESERLDWIQQRWRGERCQPLCQQSTAAVSAVRPVLPLPGNLHRIEPTTEVYSNFSRASYIGAVERVIEYIRAGDIFQANLSQQLHAEWQKSPLELFLNLRRLNPAPFCGLLLHEDTAVISASPERFLKVNADGRVETRPIKGTRRRQRSPIADLYVGAELAASEKDRAENVMIVDLLRNDISRNCARGSVKVTGLCEIERFETVLHLVSTVEGRLAVDRDVWHLLAGCFPGGSITGAPKIRAMEIIAELEQLSRGAWCGSLFALGPQGEFDSSILIRTFTWAEGWVKFPVGGGVVADSNPLDEYRETLHKASGMIRALRSAEQDA
jgi:para-aminobenzoate synthetase component 1